MLKSAGLIASGLVTGAVIASGLVTHSIPSSTTHVITACVKSTGATRLIDYQAGKRCVKGEKAVSWNQTGPRGLTGLRGMAGTDGVAGADGATGPTGPAGPMGPAGPAGPQGSAGQDGTNGATGVPGPQGATGAKGDTGPSDAYATSTFGQPFTGASTKQLVVTLPNLPAGSYVVNADITAQNGIGHEYFGCGLDSTISGQISNLSYSTASPAGEPMSVHVSGPLTTNGSDVTVSCYFFGASTVQWYASTNVNAIKVGTLHTS
jgi:hypothetical protein